MRENLTRQLQNSYHHYMRLADIDEKIYKGDPHEMVGRFVTNAFGVKENVIMPKFDWDYLDWLVSIGADLDEIISGCDYDRNEFSLSTALRSWINHAYWLREEENLPQPPWMTE